MACAIQFFARRENHLTHTWVNAQKVAEATGVSLPTAYKLIERFLDHKLLREITGAKRDRIFLFEPYLQLFR